MERYREIDLDKIDEKIEELAKERRQKMIDYTQSTDEVEKMIIVEQAESCLKQMDVLRWAINCI